jgi:radical SAM superfamily enzyme YgiQ (UPF0313 family)
MKFLLYKPKTDDGSRGEQPSLGMGIVARSIKDAGHTIEVCDAHMDGEKFTWGKYDIMAFSLVSINADIIKPDKCYCPTWLGGPHAYSYADKIDDFDKIIIGEADGQIDTIINSKDRIVNLPRPTKLLAPDYTDFYGNQSMIGYTSYISRGCTNRCSFCQSGHAHGKFRKRDLDGVYQEFDGIRQFPNVQTVHMVDDSFSADIEHAKTFLEWYVSQSFPYKLNIFNVRADQIDYELLDLMKRAGVSVLPIGVESGDETVYGFVGKGENLTDIEIAIEMIQGAGITPWLNMIVGLPKDNPERNRNSIRWAQRVRQPKIVHWFQYAPFRGTKAYSWMVSQGAIKDGYTPNPYGDKYNTLPWKPDFGTSDFTAEEREAAQLEAYLSTRSPILINNINHVMDLCLKYGFMDLLEEWFMFAPIRKYVEKDRPNKQRKGQL